MKKLITLSLIVPAFAIAVATTSFAQDANTAAPVVTSAPTTTVSTTLSDAKAAVAADKTKLKADEKTLAGLAPKKAHKATKSTKQTDTAPAAAPAKN